MAKQRRQSVDGCAAFEELRKEKAWRGKLESERVIREVWIWKEYDVRGELKVVGIVDKCRVDSGFGTSLWG